MSEDHGHPQDPTDAQDPREDYVAPPALTDLGSFQELTQLGSGTHVDAEGMS
jgi:hypothetical protein